MSGLSDIRLDRLVEGLPTVLEAYSRIRDEDDSWVPYVVSDFDLKGAPWRILPIHCTERVWDSLTQDMNLDLDYSSSMQNLEALFGDLRDLLFSAVPKDRIVQACFSRFDGEVDLDMHAHRENRGHLVFHLCVELPDDDVGTEHSEGVFQWKEVGDYLIFDNSRNHRAWSKDGVRTLLFVEFLSV
jgi:hypothetical protein